MVITQTPKTMKAIAAYCNSEPDKAKRIAQIAWFMAHDNDAPWTFGPKDSRSATTTPRDPVVMTRHGEMPTYMLDSYNSMMRPDHTIWPDGRRGRRY